AARRLRVPYALSLVVSGLLVGAPRLLPQVHLDPRTLFTVFLPPLLFESAINLPAARLRLAWKPTPTYPPVGTTLSTFIVGFVATALLGLPLRVTLIFGALISTTDPISVLAIFKRLRAGKRLTLLVEAESLFNNDTAVVLFTVLMAVGFGGQ